MDSVGVGRVEGKCDHGLLLVKVDADHSVVVCSAVGLKFFVVLAVAMSVIVLLHFLVCNPDRAEAGGFGGRDVDSVAGSRWGGSSHRGSEFKHFVFDETVVEDSLHERDGHVVRADAFAGLAFQPNGAHFRGVDVPRVFSRSCFTSSPPPSPTPIVPSEP